MLNRSTQLRFQAMGAAIPQALLLLHAMMDILPYPKGDKGMWYEIRTGSVECVDEVKKTGKVGKGEKSKDAAGKGQAVGEVIDLGGIGGMEAEEHAGLGGMEEDEPERVARIKVRRPYSAVQLSS